MPGRRGCLAMVLAAGLPMARAVPPAASGPASAPAAAPAPAVAAPRPRLWPVADLRCSRPAEAQAPEPAARGDRPETGAGAQRPAPEPLQVDVWIANASAGGGAGGGGSGGGAVGGAGGGARPPAAPASAPAADCGWMAAGPGGAAGIRPVLLVRVQLRGWIPPGDPAVDPTERLGAVSRWRGLRYWSHQDGRRQVLIREVQAVIGPADRRARGDFSRAELASGQPLHLLQRDNRADAPVLFELRGQALPGGGLALQGRNREPVRYLLLTLAEADGLQWRQQLEPMPGGGWRVTVWLAQARLALGSRQTQLRSSLARALALHDGLTGRETAPPADWP